MDEIAMFGGHPEQVLRLHNELTKPLPLLDAWGILHAEMLADLQAKAQDGALTAEQAQTIETYLAETLERMTLQLRTAKVT